MGIGLSHAEIIGRDIKEVKGVQIRLSGISNFVDCTSLQLARIRETSPLTEVYTGPSSAKDLIHSPKVDAVIVASPDHCHFEHAYESLSLGKPVLVEKPFVLDREEGDRLLDYAKQKKLQIDLSTQMRYHQRPMELLEEAVESNAHMNHSVKVEYYLKEPNNGKGLTPGRDIFPHVISTFPGLRVLEVGVMDGRDFVEFSLDIGSKQVYGSVLMGYVPEGECRRKITIYSGLFNKVLTHEGLVSNGSYYERWVMPEEPSLLGWIRNPREQGLREWTERIILGDSKAVQDNSKRVRREHHTFMDAMDSWKK